MTDVPASLLLAGDKAKALLTRLLQVNVLLLIAFPIALLFFPRFTDDIPLIGVLAIANCYAIFAATWDILSGYTGQVSFGHAAFIGTGAYTVALMDKYHPGLPGELVVLSAAALSALLGLIIGVPCMRLRGPYLGLATIAVASALVQITFIFKDQAGGEDGISGVQEFGKDAVFGPVGRGLAKTVIGGGTFSRLDGLSKFVYINYFVTLVAMVLVVGGLMLLGYGKRGLVLRSIQQDETAAEAAGVPVTRYKLGAFVLSAACAGLAGGLFAKVNGSVSLGLLAVELSLLVIIIAAVGGVGTIIGPVVGAYAVIGLNNFYLDKISFYSQHAELKAGTFALLLIVVLIVQPRGLVPPVLGMLSRLRIPTHHRSSS